MILIQSNPQFLERWQALPEEQRERFGRDHLVLQGSSPEGRVRQITVDILVR